MKKLFLQKHAPVQLKSQVTPWAYTYMYVPPIWADIAKENAIHQHSNRSSQATIDRIRKVCFTQFKSCDYTLGKL